MILNMWAKRYFYTIIIIITILFSSCAGGRSSHSFNKSNRKYYKWKYASNIRKPKKVCREVRRNKKRTKNRKVRSSGKSWKEKKVYAMAEVDDPSEIQQRPKPKPKPVNKSVIKPEPTEPKETSGNEEEGFRNKTFEEQTLSERHQMEDEVFERNNIPKPTSRKHEEIRKLVADKLQTHKDGDPIKLEPLYFTFGDAEFAVVDMDPFLIAVEYALQGRMLLIEGHTDNQGLDEFNVDLSMKRVDKIRQLMHDMGVPDDRISIIGYGEEVSVHSNQTEEGRQLNRRVDFTVF